LQALRNTHLCKGLKGVHDLHVQRLHCILVWQGCRWVPTQPEHARQLLPALRADARLDEPVGGGGVAVRQQVTTGPCSTRQVVMWAGTELRGPTTNWVTACLPPPPLTSPGPS
jgi:hypothetical protein